MVSKRNSGNDIIIILGAKAETEEQFKELFSDFENFNDYGIITQNGKVLEKSASKNIYLMSQEFLKFKQGNKLNLEATNEQLLKIKPNIRKNIDIYFDEIHKGGSSDRSKEVLETFIKLGFQIDLFVMVSATFAKPSIAYEGFLEGQSPVIIQWNYEDQQLMKI